MIRTFLLALLCSFGFAQSGAFIGAAGGPNSTFQIDMAIPMYHADYTAWGFHVSMDQRTPQDNQLTARYTPDHSLWGTTTTRENESKGVGIGGYLNMGRGFVAVGVNMITQQNEVVKVWQDGTMETLQNQQNKLMGQYIKTGYNWGKLTVYAGFSTHYKASLGIGYNW